LIDVKSLPRTFRAAIDAHQGGASCTPCDPIVAVEPSTITGLSVVVSIAGGFPYGHVALGTIREIENASRRFSPLYMPEHGVARDETAARTWMPLANISEIENEYLIKIELPDVKKEDVKSLSRTASSTSAANVNWNAKTRPRTQFVSKD
jgi:hypothetical protein